MSPLGQAVFNQAPPMIQPRALVLGSWAPLWWESTGWTEWGKEGEAEWFVGWERGRSREERVVRNRLT